MTGAQKRCETENWVSERVSAGTERTAETAVETVGIEEVVCCAGAVAKDVQE